MNVERVKLKNYLFLFSLIKSPQGICIDRKKVVCGNNRAEELSSNDKLFVIHY